MVLGEQLPEKQGQPEGGSEPLRDLPQDPTRDTIEMLLGTESDAELPVLGANHDKETAGLLEYLLEKTGEIPGNRKQLPAGTLIHEGEQRDQCLLITSGGGDIVVRKTVHHPDGDVTIRLATLHAPVLIGELALMAPDSRATATVTCEEPVECISISLETLADLTAGYPAFNTYLGSLKDARIAQQVHAVAKAENALTRVQLKEDRRELRSFFTIDETIRNLEEHPEGVERGRIRLHGKNKAGKTMERTFVVSARYEKTIVAVPTTETVPVPLLGKMQWLPDALRFRTRERKVPQTRYRTGEVVFTVDVLDEKVQQPQNIVTFHVTNDGGHAKVKGIDTYSAGIEGFSFMSQILREAFAQVQRINTEFRESQTVSFLNEERGKNPLPEREAPSILAAHAPLIAARKGFATQIDTITSDRIWATSYRIDQELEHILSVLINIERSIIDQKGRYKDAYRNLEATYEETSAQDLLDWAGQALKTYRGSHNEQLGPEVQTLLDLQEKRIDQLWRLIPVSETMMPGMDS